MNKKLQLIILLVFIAVGWANAQETTFATEGISNEIKQNYQIALYPNPTTDYLTIKSKADDFQEVEFEIYSLIGNKVQLKVEKVDDSEYRIPVKEYASGQYILIIKDKSTRYRRAFKFQKVIR